MTRLFLSNSCGTVGLVEFDSPPPSPFFRRNNEEEKEEEKFFEGKLGKKMAFIKIWDLELSCVSKGNQSPVLEVLMAAPRKSLVTCSFETKTFVVSSLDIGSPTKAKHISHVTFDRFNGFLVLPTDPCVKSPRRAPSASAKVFGVFGKRVNSTRFTV